MKIQYLNYFLHINNISFTLRHYFNKNLKISQINTKKLDVHFIHHMKTENQQTKRTHDKEYHFNFFLNELGSSFTPLK